MKDESHQQISKKDTLVFLWKLGWSYEQIWVHMKNGQNLSCNI